MTGTLCASRLTMAVVGGLLFSSIAATEGTVADAAEIKVLTSVALTSALDELAPQYERATGNKLNIGYSLIADIRKRIIAGETADVIVLSRPVMDELQSKISLRPAASQMLWVHRSQWRYVQVRRNRTSARSMRLSVRCSLPNLLSMQTRRKAARVVCILRASLTDLESLSK